MFETITEEDIRKMLGLIDTYSKSLVEDILTIMRANQEFVLAVLAMVPESERAVLLVKMHTNVITAQRDVIIEVINRMAEAVDK